MASAMFDEKDRSGKAAAGRIPGEVMKVAARSQGKEYEIEELLSAEDEYPIRFGLKGHPDRELLIHRNEAIGYLIDHQIDLCQCGIPQFQPYAIEEKGRAVIREKMAYSLADIPWQSNGKKLNPKDVCAAKPIIDLIKGLIALPFLPAPLNRESFGFNAKGEMRATHLLLARKKTWVEIEKFVFESIAHDLEGNFYHPVYDYLMKQSGLIKHIYRKFEK